jgi:transcriptional regulator with XRE-family HTH domain
MMRLRNRLQGARGRKGHALRDVASVTGIDASTLSELERGSRSLSPRVACALAPYLNTAPLTLMHDDAADRLDRHLAFTGGKIGYIDTATEDGVPVGRALSDTDDEGKA